MFVICNMYMLTVRTSFLGNSFMSTGLLMCQMYFNLTIGILAVVIDLFLYT